MSNFLSDFLQNRNITLPEPRQGRIVAAMSGGVDSSVAAALCHALGYEVIGVTLQLYEAPKNGGSGKACCAGTDIRDAKQVADSMGFAHYVLNYESRFRAAVIDDFADSYMRGETPVPCIRCNASVKFSDLLALARDLSARALVTGHYVRRSDREGRATLLTARDEGKDQSYFMFATASEVLDFLYFPLGDLLKHETRALARYFGLSVAEKSESQDICFVGREGYGALLRRLRPESACAGDIVHVSDGRILGRHAGIANYTIGQRKGLGIGGRDARSAPLYVVALRADSNEVVVGDYSYLAVREVILREVNWLGEESVESLCDYDVAVKFRSSMGAVSGRATFMREDRVRVIFSDLQYGVSAGQACVFYLGERVLGGGFIEDIVPLSAVSAWDVSASAVLHE